MVTNKKINIYKLLVIILSVIMSIVFTFFVFNYSLLSKQYTLNKDVNNISRICIINESADEDFKIVKEVDLDRINEFLDDLKHITYLFNFKKMFKHSKEKTENYSFLIEYSDGSYEIISRANPRYIITGNEIQVISKYKYYVCINDDFTKLVVKYLLD